MVSHYLQLGLHRRIVTLSSGQCEPNGFLMWLLLLTHASSLLEGSQWPGYTTSISLSEDVGALRSIRPHFYLSASSSSSTSGVKHNHVPRPVSSVSAAITTSLRWSLVPSDQLFLIPPPLPLLFLFQNRRIACYWRLWSPCSINCVPSRSHSNPRVLLLRSFIVISQPVSLFCVKPVDSSHLCPCLSLLDASVSPCVGHLFHFPDLLIALNCRFCKLKSSSQFNRVWAIELLTWSLITTCI